MMREKHFLGHRKRLKEKFLKGKHSLMDYEILELVLSYAIPRRDTKPLAKSLISKFGSLKRVLTANSHELESVSGVGKGILLFWEILREFLIRVEKEKLTSKPCILSPEDVVNYMNFKIGFSSKESFWLILLDNKNRVIEDVEVARGTPDQATVYLREVFSIILKHEASGIILVHNHPGGDPSPSLADRELTRKIHEIGRSLGIRVLDHIIVAEQSHFSFKEKGLI